MLLVLLLDCAIENIANAALKQGQVWLGIVAFQRQQADDNDLTSFYDVGEERKIEPELEHGWECAGAGEIEGMTLESGIFVCQEG